MNTTRPPEEPLFLRFHGHATFSLHLDDGVTLLVDPYRAGGFGGLVALPPLPNDFDFVISTHDHDDHAAFDAVPSATVIASPHEGRRFRVEHRVAAHDEYGGRLRGGLTRVLRIVVDQQTLVHLGDLGERPEGDLLDWLTERPIDVLIVPCGGYFTLGPDGAAELVARIAPRVAIPCHSSDDGTLFPQLVSRALFLRRFAAHEELEELELQPGATLPSVAVLRH